MKFLPLLRVLNIILFTTISLPFLAGQSVIRGQILDETTQDPLVGASIVVKGTTTGTITDFDGSFEISTDLNPPLILQLSYVGYTPKEIEVTNVSEPVNATLGESAITTEVVEVKGRRIGERQRQAALTVETLDNIAIRETPAANFYDGLGSLKEVDLTAASLGFKIINTRGFNSTSPVRSLQIIDGVDNQSPGLNFSLGNFLGASELDVNRVELVIGASSAFYGPNAFNGVISMESKDPYLHQGLAAIVKGGERNLIEGGLRWAQALRNGAGHEFMAYKLNFYRFQADDWEADNYEPVYDTPSPTDNPGGYDAVNIYGDEYTNSLDFRNTLSLPGLGVVHRTGYREIDLVDYDSENTKLGAAVHFRLAPVKQITSPELILASNYSTGTTVYQGDNRYSLRDIQFFQHRLELRKRDKYFLRFYATHEDAGNSYDPYFTALLLQRRAKPITPTNRWNADYINYWQTSVMPQLTTIEGYPRAVDYIGRPDELRAARAAFLGQPNVRDQLYTWHGEARAVAQAGNVLSNTQDFYEPGTQRFQEAFDDITSRISFAENGTRFYDKSALFHGHGEYKWTDLVQSGSITDLDLTIGANARLYTPDSKGSILLDTNGREIRNSEFGIYGGGTMEFNSKLRASASIRMDKNQNFDYLFSPAASLVYNAGPLTTMRLSFSSAIRNPTLQDQYLFYNVGRAILIGNLEGFRDLITVESIENYFNTNDRNVLEYFDVAPIEPEKVKTVEAGIRTTLFDKIYADATYYYSFYRDFIGFNLGVEAAFEPVTGQAANVQAYRVAANATDRVTTQGFSLGLNYYFAQYYVVNGNYSWNVLNTATDDPIIPAFNTPEHKFNFGLAGRDIPVQLGGLRINNFGFNVNYKWIDDYLFEGSPQFTGFIESYGLLDAQVNVRANRLNTTFKLGASNVLNNEVYQVYGGPRIGRLIYFSALYDWKK